MTIVISKGGVRLKVTIIKGPHFEQAEKKAHELLYKSILKEAKTEQRKGA
jgi:hypothetical protein